MNQVQLSQLFLLHIDFPFDRPLLLNGARRGCRHLLICCGVRTNEILSCAYLVTDAYIVPITILHAFAISTTSFRLLYRKHKRNLWWDDAWAALGLILDVVYLITWWFRSDTAGMFSSTSLIAKAVLTSYI